MSVGRGRGRDAFGTTTLLRPQRRRCLPSSHLLARLDSKKIEARGDDPRGQIAQ
jgi:hypothetical protein